MSVLDESKATAYTVLTTEPESTPQSPMPVEISDDAELCNRGVPRCHIGKAVDLNGWADELSRVSPVSVFAEDGEFAQYRNIMGDPGFPFDAILTAITPCLNTYFVDSAEEVVLDDAFAIHYNESHCDTRVAKHTDPSDITVNLCLERTEDLEGSQVQFFGAMGLKNKSSVYEGAVDATLIANENFLVNPENGWATVHWGKHPHLVTSLRKGSRTNVVLTYVYADKSRTRLGKSDCFLDEALLSR
mmetsp:Transcript_56791/g.113835  ORF Transcript_56791/g.113835 Transcript_56791/m.113835 type:complete len:245 (+) Transcript_56791:48-782(+)